MGRVIFGLSRKTAAEFSFFLAILTMFAATAYDLYKNWALLRLDDLPVFAVGFIASFIAAMWAVKSFIKFIQPHLHRLRLVPHRLRPLRARRPGTSAGSSGPSPDRGRR